MRILLPLAAVAVSCASTPPPRPPPPVTPTAKQKSELPRSSIAAILLHREDLDLTPTQVETLARRDDALAREDAALRARVAATIASAYREALYDQQHPSTVHGRADAGT
jgi:hypothetical protein